MPITIDLIHDPRHIHDCDACVHLGSIARIEGLTPTGVEFEDLYACPGVAGVELIHRAGPEDEYRSMPASAVKTYFIDVDATMLASPSAELYIELYRRAQQAGIIPAS